MHEKLRPGEKGSCVGKLCIFQWFPSKFFHSGYSRTLWNSERLGHTPSRYGPVGNGFVFQHLPVFCLVFVDTVAENGYPLYFLLLLSNISFLSFLDRKQGSYF